MIISMIKATPLQVKYPSETHLDKEVFPALTFICILSLAAVLPVNSGCEIGPEVPVCVFFQCVLLFGMSSLTANSKSVVNYATSNVDAGNIYQSPTYGRR